MRRVHLTQNFLSYHSSRQMCSSVCVCPKSSETKTDAWHSIRKECVYSSSCVRQAYIVCCLFLFIRPFSFLSNCQSDCTVIGNNCLDLHARTHNNWYVSRHNRCHSHFISKLLLGGQLFNFSNKFFRLLCQRYLVLDSRFCYNVIAVASTGWCAYLSVVLCVPLHFRNFHTLSMHAILLHSKCMFDIIAFIFGGQAHARPACLAGGKRAAF